MKKKFIAVACALALAVAVPAGAMAADESAGDGNTTPGTTTPAADPADDPTDDEGDGDAATGPFTVTEEDGTVTVEVADKYFSTWVPNEDGIQEEENILEKITLTGVKDGSVSADYVGVGGIDENGDYVGGIDTAKYGEDAVKDYVKQIQQVGKDKGKYMFSIELNGQVADGEDYAVVTFQLNKDLYGGKTITYYILHEDGSIQTKVVNVHADGTVRIHMKSFSIVTFLDVEGITKYENMVEPQDGDALSPKTGC